MSERFDVIIIGTGPAGIFAALELVKKNGTRVLMIEKGSDITRRTCPMHDADMPCAQCELCGILCGWGGAGAYSDGKLTLTSAFGGWLGEYLQAGELVQLIEEVDAVYLRYGADKDIHGEDRVAVERIRKKGRSYGLELVPARIRHIGTDLCKVVLKNIREHLEGKVTMLFNAQVAQVMAESGATAGVVTADGKRYAARAVILAVGREGSSWLSSEAKRLGLSLQTNPVDIGVRV